MQLLIKIKFSLVKSYIIYLVMIIVRFKDQVIKDLF